MNFVKYRQEFKATVYLQSKIQYEDKQHLSFPHTQAFFMNIHMIGFVIVLLIILINVKRCIVFLASVEAKKPQTKQTQQHWEKYMLHFFSRKTSISLFMIILRLLKIIYFQILKYMNFPYISHILLYLLHICFIYYPEIFVFVCTDFFINRIINSQNVGINSEMSFP